MASSLWSPASGLQPQVSSLQMKSFFKYFTDLSLASDYQPQASRLMVTSLRYVASSLQPQVAQIKFPTSSLQPQPSRVLQDIISFRAALLPLSKIIQNHAKLQQGKRDVIPYCFFFPINFINFINFVHSSICLSVHLFPQPQASGLQSQTSSLRLPASGLRLHVSSLRHQPQPQPQAYSFRSPASY